MKLLLVFLLAALPVHAQLVLSEIMFDLDGPDSPNEFVECYNASPIDTVDLFKWKIADLWSSDEITDAGQGTLVPPLSYVLIFEGDYPIDGGIYATLIPESAVVVRVDDSSIGNQLSASDSLYLVSESGDTVDSYGWEDVSHPGFSLERRRLDETGDATNWTVSLDSLGTPGFRNSVAPHPVDGAVREASITHSPGHPGPHEAVELYATVYNVGIETFDGVVTAEEESQILASNSVYRLRERDSVDVTLLLPPLSPGIHTVEILLEVEGDGDRGNNAAKHELTVPFTERSVVFNEIHYGPDPGIPEFVEIVNLNEMAIDLTGWSFSEGRATTVGTFRGGIVPSGGFAVIGADSSLLPHLPEGGLLVVPEGGFPSLNDDGDALFLFEPAGSVIDSLVYAPSWGGGEGRSMEKLNPALDSWSESSWGTCVALEKMTPGSTNSIFFQSLPSTGAIALEPNPFSPDKDGFEDVMNISYSLPFRQAYLTVLVFDVEGRNVKTVVRNLATGSQGTVTWDGQSRFDGRARIGIYVVKISAVDAESGRQVEWVETAVLAEPL